MTSKPKYRSYPALIGIAMLTACGGGSGNGSSSEPVVATPPATFVISGTVPTFLNQGTEVSLNLSGERFATTTDAQGRYELTLEGDITDTGFAVITALGQDSQEFIEFKSVLGQVSALKALAGSDSTLTVDEFAATHISEMTTAAAGLAMIEQGGVMADSEDAWRASALNINAEELLIASSAIRLAIKNPDMRLGMIPDGETTMGFATSTEALYRAVEMMNAAGDTTKVDAKMEAIQSAAAIKLQRPESLENIFIFEPGYRSSAYQFLSDGTGNRFNNSRNEVREFAWTEADKTIEFYYDNWVVDSNTVKIDIDGDGTEEDVLEEVVLTKTDLVFVSEQADYDVVNITDYFIKRYPDNADTLPDEPFDRYEDKNAGRGAKAFYGATGQSFNQPQGDIAEWILPIPGRWSEEYPDGRFYVRDVTFDFMIFDPANAGAGAEVGSFDWRVNSDGHLLITTEQGTSLEYLPLANRVWGVIERDDSDSVVGMNVTFGSARDYDEANASAFTPGVYTLEWSWLEDRNSQFWIEINEDGSARSVWTADRNGDGIVTVGESQINTGDWSNEFENLMINFYRNNGPDNYDPCASDQLEGCVIYNRRFWDIFAVDGDRFYVGHTHTFFDYLDDYQTRYLLDARYWVRLNEAPLDLIQD
jgi:hypothetical protein